MKTKLILSTIICTLILCGCSNLFRGIITVTEIRKAVMNELGEEKRAGRINAQDWSRVVAADVEYHKAAEAAELVLKTYRDTGAGDTAAALRAVKNTVSALIQILGSYQSVNQHETALSKASKL